MTSIMLTKKGAERARVVKMELEVIQFLRQHVDSPSFLELAVAVIFPDVDQEMGEFLLRELDKHPARLALAETEAACLRQAIGNLAAHSKIKLTSSRLIALVEE